MKTSTTVYAGLLGGLVAGIATFIYARVITEPLVAKAVSYEEARSEAEAHLTGAHGHEHEIFTRSIQQNVGAGVGTVIFALGMGGLFSVAFVLVVKAIASRGRVPDLRVVAGSLAAVMFVAIYLTPALIYPANPPAVGLEDTLGARTTGYLSAVVVSMVAATLCVGVWIVVRERIGGLYAGIASAVGYGVVMVVAGWQLPAFDEVPGQLTASGRVVFPGFPAEVLAEFRLASIGGQLMLWAVLGVVVVVVVDRVNAGRVPLTESMRRSDGKAIAGGAAARMG